MKKFLLLSCVAAVVGAGLFGLFVYRKATPSSADHRLLTLASGSETVSSVTLNLRLVKSARSVESLKDRVESAEKYLLKFGAIPPRHRDLFLETFSSVASGTMKTAEGTSPFRLFAAHVPAEQALEALKGAHLVEATSGDDYVLIHPETCEREGPLRLVRGEQVLAFVPTELAAGITTRLAQTPAQEMDALLIAKAGINVAPYLEAQAPGLVRMVAAQTELADTLRHLDVSLRADKGGGLWADLELATDQQQQLQEFWETKTRGDEPLRVAVRAAVKLVSGKEGLRFTFDVNALQKHADALLLEVFPSSGGPLKAEDVEAITEETLLEAGEVFPYDEPLTPETFFARSGEDCEASGRVRLGDTNKLGLEFEALSSNPGMPGTDFLRLTAHACLPAHHVPLLGLRPLLDVAIQSPRPVRQFCGPLAAEEDAVASEETFDSSLFSDRHTARNEVQFALEPGTDAQKLKALEGSVTVHVPTRVKKLELAFAPPYARTELALPEGRLYVEGTESGAEGLMFKLVGEGAHPTVLAVRALNSEGKYLKTEARRGRSGNFFDLPFQDLLPESRDVAVTAYGKPARLEVVVVEASTPLTRPFTLTPPFPLGEDDEGEDAAEAPRPVAALDQGTYEKTFLNPEHVAREEAEFRELLENNQDDHAGNVLRTDSPFKVALRTAGIFRGDLSLYWLEDVGAGFQQLDTPLALEIHEVDFADGTRLRATDIEAVEGEGEEKRYVWDDGMGRPVAWRTNLSLRQTNGGYNAFTLILFDDYIPARLEDVPVARIKGQLSFSLPQSVSMSSPAPLSLHSHVQVGADRFRVTSIEQDGVSVESERTNTPGYSVLFTDGAGRRVDASLRKRTDFEDGTFRLAFDTRGPIREWRMLQPQGGSKTYTYPFEVVTQELKPVAGRAKKRARGAEASSTVR
ncbi:hypothetical protein ACLESD_00080 [Pyxidicoccus sp. 3LFB2]